MGAVVASPVSFKVGDAVVFPAQGGGVVDEVTERDVLGERKAYLKIRFLRSNMDMLVPMEKGSEVGLRHAIEPGEVKGIEAAVRAADLSLPSSWPPRHRAEQEILDAGNAYQLARLVGTLSIRDRDKGLASTERDLMEAAKMLLASELAVVRKTTLGEAVADIDATITDLLS